MNIGGAGRADIVVQNEDGVIIIIELKASELKRKDVMQLAKYLKKMRESYDEVQGVLIGWDTSKSVEKRIEQMRTKGYDIKSLIYDAKLRVREV